MGWNAAHKAGISREAMDAWALRSHQRAIEGIDNGSFRDEIFPIDVTREEKVNVLGSGCSLGHPVAMTGTRMVMTMVHELRRRGGGIGVCAMCAGGGMASAVVLDVAG